MKQQDGHDSETHSNSGSFPYQAIKQDDHDTETGHTRKYLPAAPLNPSEAEAGKPIDDIRCNIYRKENFAIAMAYFAVGLVSSLLSTPLNVYVVHELNAEPAVQNTLNILQSLPWSFKLLFGFLSDAFPIAGLHRKPYFAMGAIVYSASFAAYGLLGMHNVQLLSLCLFLGTVGLIQMDVMADTLCVQRSKFEPEEKRGHLQAACYSIRFFGGLIGAVLGATLCNRQQWGWGLTYPQVSIILGLVPFVLVVPWLPPLVERFQSVALLRIQSAAKKAQYAERRSRRRAEASAAGADRISYQQQVEMKRHPSLSGRRAADSQSHNRSPAVPKSAADIVASENSRLLQKGPSPTPVAPASPTVLAVPASPYSADEPPPTPLMTPGLRSAVAGAAEADALRAVTEDDEPDDTVSIREQMLEIWDTVQLKSVWRPMIFVYTYNLLQVPNVAWQSYLQLTLHFQPYILGLTVILGSFMTWAGVVAYKAFFFKASWRSIYLGTSMLTTFFSLLQLVLIFQWNTRYLHLSNYLFSLGDDVISAYISGIQFLPVCIMYMQLCPAGAEGASYALLTTFGNIALVCASDVGFLLAGVWDVSNTALRNGNVSGLWRLSLLTSGLALLPLFLLFLLPGSPEEQKRLAKDQHQSPLGGALFLIALFGSILWSVVTAVVSVM